MTAVQARRYSAQDAALLQRTVRAVMSTGGGQMQVGYASDIDLDDVARDSFAKWATRNMLTMAPTGYISTGAISPAHALALAEVHAATGATMSTHAKYACEPGSLSYWTQLVNEPARTYAAPANGKSEPEKLETAAATLRVARLVELQAILGLSTSDLADALGITRQGLYKWLDATKEQKLQGANRARLALIERVAKKWRDHSSAPLSKVVHEPLAAGGTTLERFTAEAIDEASFDAVFDELRAKLAAEPLSRSQKLAAAGFKRRPSLRSTPDDDE